MLNLVSILVGLVALVLAIVGMFPLLGWINWFALPLAVIGGGLGALSSSNQGRNLSLVVFVVACLRLMIGGGFI